MRIILVDFVEVEVAAEAEAEGKWFRVEAKGGIHSKANKWK